MEHVRLQSKQRGSARARGCAQCCFLNINETEKLVHTDTEAHFNIALINPETRNTNPFDIVLNVGGGKVLVLEVDGAQHFRDWAVSSTAATSAANALRADTFKAINSRACSTLHRLEGVRAKGVCGRGGGGAGNPPIEVAEVERAVHLEDEGIAATDIEDGGARRQATARVR